MPFQKWNVVANILTACSAIPFCCSRSAVCCDDTAFEDSTFCWNDFKSLTPSVCARWPWRKFGAGAKSSERSFSKLKTSLGHLNPGLEFALLCLALISAWEGRTVLKLFKFTLGGGKKKKVKWISSKVCLTLKSSCMKNSPRLLWKLCRESDWQTGVGVICRTNAQSDPKSL